MLFQKHVLGILYMKEQVCNKIWKSNLLDPIYSLFFCIVLNGIPLDISLFHYQLNHSIFIGK